MRHGEGIGHRYAIWQTRFQIVLYLNHLSKGIATNRIETIWVVKVVQEEALYIALLHQACKQAKNIILASFGGNLRKIISPFTLKLFRNPIKVLNYFLGLKESLQLILLCEWLYENSKQGPGEKGIQFSIFSTDLMITNNLFALARNEMDSFPKIIIARRAAANHYHGF